MPQKTWRGQTATIEITGNSMPSEPIGVIDNPEVAAPEQEVQELRGAGSTEFQDLQKTETSVSVSGDVAAWDIEAWDRIIDYDEVAGKLDDSAEVATFTVTVTYNAADGSTKEIPVVDAYVDGSIPLGGSREEWIGMSLSLVGRTLGSITNTDASA
jgi:hypothetical protein